MKAETTNTEVLGDFNPHQVHFRDPLTKQVSAIKAFRVHIHQGIKYYEYPKGSGNLWWEDRKPAGRLGEDGKPVRSKEHVAWEPPKTADQTIAEKNATLAQENAKLAKELEAIKREQELQAAEAKDVKPQAKEKVAKTTAAKN